MFFIECVCNVTFIVQYYVIGNAIKIKRKIIFALFINHILVGLVGCRVKANCPLVGPRPVGGVLSVGVFLRDPSAYLLE